MPGLTRFMILSVFIRLIRLILNVGTTALKGGNFPCGLIAIDWNRLLLMTQAALILTLYSEIDLVPETTEDISVNQ